MTDIEGLRAQIELAQQGQARAAAGRERAEADLAATERALAEEFGLAPDSVPGAITVLEADVAAEEGRVRGLLARAGGIS